ncbi:MAG: hypothetical protein V3T83_16625, partial [Acidobacteriota bacterium]
MEEYIAIRAEELDLEGPFELRGWRRNPKTKRLNRIRPDKQGRLHSKTTGLLFGTGADGCGLVISDAVTGEPLRTSNEEAAWQAQARRAAEERAGQQAERAEQEAERAEQEAERAENEAEARRAAEQRNREMMAENERLRAQLRKL